MTPTDECARVTLRAIGAADTPNILRWRNSDSVRGNFLFRDELTADMHEQWLARVARGEVAQYIIILDDNDVGTVYLRDIDREHRRAEFGIYLGEAAARGHGAGTQAARLILDIAFAQLALETVFLRVLSDNAAAIRSYEKAGFLRCDCPQGVQNNSGQDVVFMQIGRRKGGNEDGR